MKVGDYVRTTRGTFDRFITSQKHDNLTWYCFENRGNITNPENYIIKSSPNIIDLIEVGDYVNGYKIVKKNKYTLYLEDGLDEESNLYIGQDNIESIVTKEQFESMEYKICTK